MHQRAITRYTIYLLLFLLPILPYKAYIGKFPLSIEIILIPAFILGVGYDLWKRRIEINQNPIKWLLIPYASFAVFALISIVFAKSKSTGIMELARYVSYGFVLFILLKIKFSKDDFSQFVRIFFLSVIFVGVYGVLQYVFDYDLNTAGLYALHGVKGRVASFFINPNYYGGFINFVLPFLLIAIIMFVKEKRKQLLLFVLYGILVINSILTYTRASWMIMVGAFVLTIILLGKDFIKKLLKPHIIVAFLLLGGVIVTMPDVSDRFNSALIAMHNLVFGGNTTQIQQPDEDTTNQALFSRTKLWKTGIKMYEEHPVIGVGLGNYLVRYKEYITKYPELDVGQEAYSVHNSYIKVGAETGSLGLISYLAIYFMLFYQIAKYYFKSKDIARRSIIVGVGVGIVTFILQNLTNNLMFIPQLNTIFWLGTALYLNYLYGYLRTE